MPTRERNGTVQSIDRALSLLEALGQSGAEVGIAALSKRVGLHVSTTHRILGTLIERGYARQNPDTGQYALGSKAVQLAESYLGQVDLRRIVRPTLERITAESGETANLVILDGREALYLDKVESAQNLRIFSRIGHRAPLYCTAVGKVLMAARTKDEVEALLGRGTLEPLTAATITSRPLLRRELEKVREQGFALDCEECEEGACCIAVPLTNARGRVDAAISVSGPSVRVTKKRMEELIPLMREVSMQVSAALGWNPVGG